MLEAVRQEAVWYGDMVVLPGVWEHYHNITHQTLEILRFAAVEPSVTHVLKVRAKTPGMPLYLSFA